ncbi:MAG: DNA-3-methyladenine glycosylase 1 [Fimbriimonadaceae bacterium]|nr:DNA-3-methyladenine glycosylase 1 [Fimbriimonadaceae bacterium]
MADTPAFTSYCDYVANLPTDNRHRVYHDTAYGFPIEDDDLLFERLILEINQAGLSWDTILKKQESFREAYGGFRIPVVAAYGEEDRARLLSDAGIIRNRLKVNAAIENANRLLGLQREFGSFSAWLRNHHPLPKEEWVKLFKKTFVFTGGEIVGEFLMSTGYLPGSHVPHCPVYEQVRLAGAPWAQ